MTQIALFPGTFDPITLGHQDLIQRAAKIFPEIIVAVAENKSKAPLFSLTQRVTMIEQALQHIPNVSVAGFDNLLVDFATYNKSAIILRGVRITADFEYELQLSNVNRALNTNLETLFLTPSENFSFVSSTVVKELAQLGGDVSKFVHPAVAKALNGVSWR